MARPFAFAGRAHLACGPGRAGRAEIAGGLGFGCAWNPVAGRRGRDRR